MINKATKATAAALVASAALVGLEGYGEKPYLDSAGVLTDCYGNTKNVSKNTIRTKAECTALLDAETYRIANNVLDISRHEIPTITLASFVSFAYNVGDSAFKNSTLIKKWNSGDFVGACREMYRWRYVTVAGVKVPLPGLDNRRKVEVAMCLEGVQQ